MRRFLRDAVVAFVYWTGTLTPYMVFVVGVTSTQYLRWMVMQAILTPPLGVTFMHLTRKLK